MDIAGKSDQAQSSEVRVENSELVDDMKKPKLFSTTLGMSLNELHKLEQDQLPPGWDFTTPITPGIVVESECKSTGVADSWKATEE